MTKHEPQSIDQGSLFRDELVSNGAPDPVLHETRHHLEPVPGGVFAEVEAAPSIPTSFEDPDLVQAVHEAVTTERRRKSQGGKHSPLQRDGNYQHIEVGDFLPDFGPVTYTNLSQAQEKAAQLEKARNSR